MTIDTRRYDSVIGRLARLAGLRVLLALVPAVSAQDTDAIPSAS